MSTNKQPWTPGPWEIGLDCPESGWVDIVAEAARCETKILASARNQEHAQNQANASLIAAAPKLVEALQRAERKLAAYVGICGGDKELTEAVLPMVRAALTQASNSPDERDPDIRQGRYAGLENSCIHGGMK